MHDARNQRWAKVLIIFSLVVFSGACSTTGTTGGTSRSDRQSPIVAADIDAGGYDDLFDMIRQLRPHWLNNSNGVYLDGVRKDRDWLRSTSTFGIRKIESLSCQEAMSELVGSRCRLGRYIHVISLRP